jgi:hypothetical protein
LFKRISPSGTIDVEAIFQVENISFKHEKEFEFIHYSNCKFIHIRQEDKVYRFNKI